MSKFKVALCIVSRVEVEIEPTTDVFTDTFCQVLEALRHYVLSGGTQRRVLRRYQSEEMKIQIFDFLEWSSNPHPVDFTVTLRAPAPRLASNLN